MWRVLGQMWARPTPAGDGDALRRDHCEPCAKARRGARRPIEAAHRECTGKFACRRSVALRHDMARASSAGCHALVQATSAQTSKVRTLVTRWSEFMARFEEFKERCFLAHAAVQSTGPHGPSAPLRPDAICLFRTESWGAQRPDTARSQASTVCDADNHWSMRQARTRTRELLLCVVCQRVWNGFTLYAVCPPPAPSHGRRPNCVALC